ncbi:MAG: ribosomal small subunit methyltransferase [Chitinophagaceae bacterium]|jgi:16S rRNA (uracil1498-N3)-methyltransferase|nr:ribosomal small subunit methyltransferase [Chitinophagaceae bacterium]
MSIPYFYEPALDASPVRTLGEETSKHCVKVLRMKDGEQLRLTDGLGTIATATILSADKRSTEVRIESRELLPVRGRNAHIGISLLKNNNRFEWFLEKSAEIGVRAITPLLCHRTERQHFRHDRMNNILVAAMLQSQQAWLPELHEPVDIAEFIRGAGTQRFIAHCDAQEKKALKQHTLSGDVLMLVGPEGDFTTEEISQALAHEFQPVSLGETRLRAETAGVVAATLLVNL